MLLPHLFLPGLLLAQQSGLVIVGTERGKQPITASEFWTPGPKEQQCSLPSLNKMNHATLDSWENTVIACLGKICEHLTPSGWQHWRNTIYNRRGHTSAVTSQGLLLVGGESSPNTTELLPWEEGESREGFTLQEKRMIHCSIQTSPGTIVLTGGDLKSCNSGKASPGISLVTEYTGLGAGEEVKSRELPPLIQSRYGHACGWYSVGDSQVLLVTGGISASSNGDQWYLDTTEVFPYTDLTTSSWREAGILPSARYGLSAAKVNDLLHVVGGFPPHDPGATWRDLHDLDEILTWDSVSESWSVAGHMKTARAQPSITEVSLAVVADYCLAK